MSHPVPGIAGRTEIFVQALTEARGPLQHDAHCKAWRLHLAVVDAGLRAAAVAKCAREIIGRLTAA